MFKKMSKELVLKRVATREGNNYSDEIPLPLEGRVIQRFSPSGHVCGTIELKPAENSVHAMGTWGRIKTRVKSRYGTGEYRFAANRKRELVPGDFVYLGPDGIYQLQEKV